MSLHYRWGSARANSPPVSALFRHVGESPFSDTFPCPYPFHMSENLSKTGVQQLPSSVQPSYVPDSKSAKTMSSEVARFGGSCPRTVDGDIASPVVVSRKLRRFKCFSLVRHQRSERLNCSKLILLIIEWLVMLTRVTYLKSLSILRLGANRHRDDCRLHGKSTFLSHHA